MPPCPPSDPSDPRWYAGGLRFSCTRCGQCCRSDGDYHFVYVADDEVAPLAAAVGMEEADFLEAHCTEDDGWVVLRSEGTDCRFLSPEGTCTVYEARPVQCRTWPFWSDNLKREVWQGPVRARCPGVDTGPLVEADEVDRIAAENDAWKDLA